MTQMKTFSLFLAIVVVAFCMWSPSNAGFGLPKPHVPTVNNMVNTSTNAPKVNIDDMLSRDGALIHHCTVASIYIAKSLIEVENAVGNKVEAEKLEAALKALAPSQPGSGNTADSSAGTTTTTGSGTTDAHAASTTAGSDQKDASAKKDSKDNTDQLKVLITEENSAAADLAKIDMEAKMDKEAAKKSVRKSYLYLGCGLLVDTNIVSDAKTQVAQTNDAINSLSADPTQVSHLQQLKATADTLQFLLSNLPGQITSIDAVHKKLHEYAEANKIDLPAKDEENKLSADMGKE